jgi:predicted oxidoreductase
MRAQEDTVMRESISSLNGDLNDLTDRVDGLEDTIQEEITDRRATIANEAEERRAADALL